MLNTISQRTKIISALLVVATILISCGVYFANKANQTKDTDLAATLTNTLTNNNPFQIEDDPTSTTNPDFNNVNAKVVDPNRTLPSVQELSLFKTQELDNDTWLLEIPVKNNRVVALDEIYGKIPNWAEQKTSFKVDQRTQTVVYNKSAETYSPIVAGVEKTKLITIEGKQKWISLRDGTLVIMDPFYKNIVDIILPNFGGTSFSNLFVASPQSDRIWLQYFNDDDRLEFQGESLVQLSITKDLDPNVENFVTSSGFSRYTLDSEKGLIAIDEIKKQLRQVTGGGDINEKSFEELPFYATDPLHSFYQISEYNYLVAVRGIREYFWIVSTDIQGIVTQSRIENLVIDNPNGSFVNCGQKRCVIVDMFNLVYYTYSLDNPVLVKQNLSADFQSIKLSEVLAAVQLLDFDESRLIQFNNNESYFWYNNQRIKISN